MKIKTTSYVPQAEDINASNYRFGVEIETHVPISCGIDHGGMWNGGRNVITAIALDGSVVTAPTFRGQHLKAMSDSTITWSSLERNRKGVEFATPILYGEEGLQFIREWIDFLDKIGAKVNRSCGLHVTFGVESVIGRSASFEAKQNFARKFVHLARNNRFAVYGQTGTNRHQNQWCSPLTSRADDIAKNSLSNLGRGMVNFGKFSEGRIEVRAFAGTTNLNKVFHHVATVLGLASRANAQKQVTVYNGRTGHGRAVDSAMMGLYRLHRCLGWRSMKSREIAHGLFGSLHSEVREWTQIAVAMCEKFDARFPNTEIG